MSSKHRSMREAEEKEAARQKAELGKWVGGCVCGGGRQPKKITNEGIGIDRSVAGRGRWRRI